MGSMKKSSRLNEKIEEIVMKIASLEIEYGRRAVYLAARRYNDRIYLSRKKKCRKKKK